MKGNIFLYILISLNISVLGGSAQIIRDWNIVPLSLVKRGEPSLQRIEMSILSRSHIKNCTLNILEGDKLLYKTDITEIKEGNNNITVEFPEPERDIQSTWVLLSNSKVLSEKELTWKPPRHWTLYVINSSHIDIGLHDSQYKQRFYSVNYIDKAASLIDSTRFWPEASRFRYVVEGTWWWFNYPADRSEQRANEVIKDYATGGLLGIGASHSGNHTQVFGSEELCRSTYYARQLRERWGLEANAALMVDNNGIAWPVVNAYKNGGIKYLGFFPNAWNPGAIIDSLGWKKESSRMNFGVNPGVGSRIDVGWNSELPHLFYWQGSDNKSKILVWTNPQYKPSGYDFGFAEETLVATADKMEKQLKLLESRYPYNVWLISYYTDNETPGLNFATLAKKWNEQWRWPELRTVGDLSQPFREVEERFGDEIPTLSGVITGGWAQHPVATPNLLAKKMEADRLLPAAEKMATLAFLFDSTYIYPKLKFQEAWDALICNDEHGYGTSYYKGRPVYDTWMQKMNWIELAGTIASQECDKAVKALSSQINTDGPSIVVFNPTLQSRMETVEVDLPGNNYQKVEYDDGIIAPAIKNGDKLKFRTTEIPPLGYKIFKLRRGDADKSNIITEQTPPIIENDFYRIRFSKNGSISGIYDKELEKELIDSIAEFQANQFVYSADANQTFSSPANARFTITCNSLEQIVTVQMGDNVSGASIEQEVILPNFEKRIDIDNRLNHVKDLASADRWKRFGYYAFPFTVPDGKFRVGLNGCDADAYKDQTGHGTNTYHVARDWAYVGNDRYGIALIQQDNYLIEFGKIHKNKAVTEEKPSSAYFFPYIFNDWLYAHAYITGPSYINLRYRFTIFSHKGKFPEGKISQLAERKVTPLLTNTIMHDQKGKLKSSGHSFMSVNNPDISLLTLKLSEEPGKGIIARFHELSGNGQKGINLRLGWENHNKLTLCSITEKDGKAIADNMIDLDPFGYNTVRITKDENILPAPKVALAATTDKSVTLTWPVVKDAREYYIFKGEYSGFTPDSYHLSAITKGTFFTDDWLSPDSTYYYIIAAVSKNNNIGSFSSEVSGTTGSIGNSPPAKVGIKRSGLISAPRVWRGDKEDILYIQWGQNGEKDLSFYEIFRSERKDFVLNEDTFISKVEPGPYVTVPFTDTGLKPHTAYYYRIRAVDKDGHRGEPSEIFRGITRELKK